MGHRVGLLGRRAGDRSAARRRTIAAAVVIALVAGIPLTIAVLHPGSSVAEVDLGSRDVWVTNGQRLLGGRINGQIDELNGSVAAPSPDVEVLQNGDALYLHDPDAGRIESVDPATTTVTSAVAVPKGSTVGYGGTTLTVVSPAGELWAIPAAGRLRFDYRSTPPLARLGAGGQATVTADGVIVAVSRTAKKIYRFASLTAAPRVRTFPSVGTFQIAAVGDLAVVFDQSTNQLIGENGVRHPLPERGLRLQQSGAKADYAAIASGDSLMEVNLDSGAVRSVPAGIPTPATDAREVAAPVVASGCAHGAWAGAQRYLLACEGEKPVDRDLGRRTGGASLQFRVNRTVIALNNTTDGTSWLVDGGMRLVDNWADVVPTGGGAGGPATGGRGTGVVETAVARRTDGNRPPTAVADQLGIRQGRATVLPVLDNDTDPDGDVLVVSAVDAIAETAGRLDLVDGGRAVQLTPAAGFGGTVSFGYSADDGRGGTARAWVTVQVVPEDSDRAPAAIRDDAVSVEADQSVSDNVLTGWRDPDGDELSLVGASTDSGDLVRFTPDGVVTFTHRTTQLGVREVAFWVSDGRGAPVRGSLRVDVEPDGTLDPVATADFDETFVTETVVVEPLANDRSPSGAQLSLVAIGQVAEGAVASFDPDRGEISFGSSVSGVFYLDYTVRAGSVTSLGTVRIDVRDRPKDDTLPPVAVGDTAYARADQPVTVPVLANDVSRNGRVLAVQSIDVPPALRADGLVVELLGAAVVRVTAPAGMTAEATFGYTISDGTKTSSAEVTVVPVPPLTEHQPPIAANDTARVRAGDVATVDVLANDVHPDGAPMTLDPSLVTLPAAGLAFVAGNELRYQAPTAPGEYRLDYRVLDPYGQTATATVTVTVVGPDASADRPPVPRSLVGRVLAGGTVRVDVPLDGVDPDGDSAQLSGFPVGPSLGSIVERGAGYFLYRSSGTARGTDTFGYEVSDAFGATGTGTVTIAVVAPPAQLSPPVANRDTVSVRPGHVAQVDLLLNDSDPQGAALSVSKRLAGVPRGIETKVIGGRYLMLTAPDAERSFSLSYTLTNPRGGKASGEVLVTVAKDAPILPPVAEDIPVSVGAVDHGRAATVDVLDGHVLDPSGSTRDLTVTVDGPNAGSARVLAEKGRIRVTPGPTRQAIAYRVTDARTGLSATAFVLVPAAGKGQDRPAIDPSLPVQYVGVGQTRQWRLEDILAVPPGHTVWITGRSTVSATQSDGRSSYGDRDTIRFTPAPGYRGPASIDFTVSDSVTGGTKARTTNLRLDVIVGDPQFRDVAPEFTPPEVRVQPGETTTIDLRDSTGQPNPAILGQVTYSNLTGTSAGLQGTLSGSRLSLTAPRGAAKGSSYRLGVTLRWGGFTVHGGIDVTVVGSTRPLAIAVADEYETTRARGGITADPLLNDVNPFGSSGEGLTVVGARVSNGDAPATVSFTGSTVTITPGRTLASGRIVVVYTVEDATHDLDRRVSGTMTLVVSDAPDGVAKPAREPDSDVGGDGTATFRFSAPATNGRPITSYDVAVSPSAGLVVPTCVAGAPCALTGLDNGTAYSIRVRAVNQNGAGPWSPPSESVTPYGVPVSPSPVVLAKTGWSPDGSITWSWSTIADTGGDTGYAWTVTDASGATVDSGGGTGVTSATVDGLAAGSYTIAVLATNSGGKAGPAGENGPVTIESQIVPGTVTVSVTVTRAEAPGAILWSWSSPSGGPAVTDNLLYFYSVDGGASVSTNSTSVVKTNLSAGTHTLTVHAENNAGAGAVGSASAVIAPRPAN